MKAFCPGHVTCFFQPVPSDDLLSSGSRGAGIRLSKGTFVTVDERTDGKVKIIMDGAPSDAPVTSRAIRTLAPGYGFDVSADNELPVSQGFAMSAAGAIATGLCICQMLGMDEREAFKAAHTAEIECKGGLGDVAALSLHSFVPVRTAAGLPPFGRVIGSGKSMDLTLAVLGKKMDTSRILSDRKKMQRIADAGSRAVNAYEASPTTENLFAASREFSRSAELETPDVARALDLLGTDEAGMCMLGNGIFTTLPEDEVKERLRGAAVINCTSSDIPARIIRKG